MSIPGTSRKFAHEPQSLSISCTSDYFLQNLWWLCHHHKAWRLLFIQCFAGCRIATHPSCALPDLQNAKARDADALALFEMLGDKADEIAEEALACALCQMMLLGQSRSELLERDGTAGLCRTNRLNLL
jgi:hypothetical protein